MASIQQEMRECREAIADAERRAAGQVEGLPLLPVSRNIAEHLAGQIIGHARTKQEAIRVALGAGIRDLKHGGEPTMNHIGGPSWLLEE